MAYTSGTATDYLDLLDKLRLYAVAQGWTQLSWTAGTVSGGGGLLQLRGPGAGTGRQVFLNFRTQADVTNSLYSWTMRGATGYTAGAPEGGNPGEQQQAVFLNLWQNAISYWFYVNDRRIIVVAKCSTAYMSMYAGFYLPFAQPQQYPFPLYVAADYMVATTWSTTNSGRRMFCDPGGSTSAASAWARDPGGLWTAVLNNVPGSNNEIGYNTSSGVTLALWPWTAGEGTASSGLENWGHATTGQASGGALDSFIATRQGERWLWPATLLGRTAPTYGVLDGVYCVPGTGIATEQALTVGARNFRIFQNIQRSSGNDFFAVEEN